MSGSRCFGWFLNKIEGFEIQLLFQEVGILNMIEGVEIQLLFQEVWIYACSRFCGAARLAFIVLFLRAIITVLFRLPQGVL